MQAFTTMTGLVAPLDRANVDTDQIIPKQFLKTIKRTGLREGLFYDWRKQKDGSQDPSFFLNQPRFHGATILLTRDNFGCGSSREHAPWALLDQGFRCIIAPSFADIFYNNCFKNGMLPIRLSEEQVEELFKRTAKHAGYKLHVDLQACELRDDHGLTWKFEVDSFRRHCLLNGLDDIGLTEQKNTEIAAYEETARLARPWVFGMIRPGA